MYGIFRRLWSRIVARAHARFTSQKFCRTKPDGKQNLNLAKLSILSVSTSGSFSLCVCLCFVCLWRAHLESAKASVAFISIMSFLCNLRDSFEENPRTDDVSLRKFFFILARLNSAPRSYFTSSTAASPADGCLHPLVWMPSVLSESACAAALLRMPHLTHKHVRHPNRFQRVLWRHFQKRTRVYRHTRVTPI